VLPAWCPNRLCAILASAAESKPKEEEKMIKKTWKPNVFLILVVFFLCIAWVLSGIPADAKYKAPRSLMSVCSQQTGSLYVTYCAAFAKVMEANFENLRMNVEPGGSSQNMILVNNKKAEFGITSSSQAYMGYWGIGWAKGKGKFNKVRALFPAYPAITAIFAMADSPIKKFEDVAGHVLCLGPRGSGSDVMGRQLLEMFGIKPERIVNASWSDMVGMMEDGLVDVVLNIGGHPAGFVQQLEVKHKLRFIPLSKEMMEKFMSAYPYYGKGTLQKVYKGMSGPQETLVIMNFIITEKDMPENFIYDTVKATWVNVNVIRSTHRTFTETDVKNLKFIPIPLHPGAIKYYKEKGIAIPVPKPGPKKSN
jgi:TRAP transporter TAXI family solute receptor